ncbi:MAG: hypothetical protein FWF05_08570 [Oscillospiraceae bacterium]|nr:hypothetical protein [Oscillospiraceae bacterium]
MNPMNNSNMKKTSQHIRFIALADMEPDSGYQRTTNPAQVANIVKRFDETKLGTITVSERGGKYHIIDGSHRTKALRNLGYTHALCEVLTGLTYEQEAEYFCKQNQDKRLLRPCDLFKAGLAAGNEKCVRIAEIAKANGFQIGHGKQNFYVLAAIHTLYTIAEDYGYKALDDTLCLIAGTWPGLQRASQREFLLGVAEFVSRYGMADFSERLKDRFAVIWYEYSEAMRVKGTVGSTASREKFCRVLVGQYNKGLVHNSKKRLKWEE